MWSLEDRFLSKQLAFQWAQTASPYLPTYIFTGVRRSLYINDGLSLNNSKILELTDLIYSCEN